MAIDNRGTITRQGIITRVNNAFVEEVFLQNNTTGYILISYADRSSGGVTFINLLQLNISRNTAILNMAGRNVCLCDIRRGMWIDAVFSSAMTRSNPPQSNAFLVLVRGGSRPPERPADTSTGRIISVDAANNSIYTGVPNNPNRQNRFIVTPNTLIRNRAGNPIRFSSLRPGQTVQIIHANFQTTSIPPQTTAFYIQVL